MENKNGYKQETYLQMSEKAYDILSREGREELSINSLLDVLSKNGIDKDDPRIEKCLGSYLTEEANQNKVLGKEEFLQITRMPEALVMVKAITGNLVLPDFDDFKKDIEDIFNEIKSITKGDMNDILPHPEPNRQPAFAVSICTVDGQLLKLGDYDLGFLLQSISKPISYAIAIEEVGLEKVHEHVGLEPGDESFDDGQILNENGLPHNSMLTSGSIMACSLIKPNEGVDERLKYVMEVWEKMTGDKKVKYNEESFNVEINNSDKHYAFSHLMRHRGAFPEDVDIDETIKFYLKCNAIELRSDDLAHAAATMANFGKCPTTGEKVFNHDSVRETLSLMHTSGMYEHSGEFAFKVGLPAKSGVAGGIMMVIPEVMGIAVYSPPMDSNGNTIRGVAFCEKFVEKFNFHKYDASYGIHGKKDPRKPSQ